MSAVAIFGGQFFCLVRDEGQKFVPSADTQDRITLPLGCVLRP